jgi:hypothetical protein
MCVLILHVIVRSRWKPDADAERERSDSPFTKLASLLSVLPLIITSTDYLSAPSLYIHSLIVLESSGTQHITKHGSSWTCSMPFNIYPSVLQEYHPMKTPSNAAGTSEPWNMIANIAHDGITNALLDAVIHRIWLYAGHLQYVPM